ncbi:MAG: transglutaminase-like cysteine peptidase [Rhizobiaceae bacterium]|nr:transglutaminase-like cysteine peptidase [Rhizobiaceae bacterium]
MKTTYLKGILAASIFAIAHMAQAAPANMVTLGKTNPPIGHYEFCKTNPGMCGSMSDNGPLQLTEAKWKTLLKVNYTANTTIEPMTDQEIYGVEERWVLPTTVGDCEDYVLLKQKMLVQRGFSPSDLLIAVVLQPNGDGHAVLVVRTDRGDFVLDNMRNKVLLWSDTEYTYLKRQSTRNAGQWVKIRDDRTPVVGSID